MPHILARWNFAPWMVFTKRLILRTPRIFRNQPHWFRGLIIATFVVAVMSIGWGIPRLGQWLTITPHPTKADAIVVLGGGDPERLDQAMALYRQGLAPEVWHTGSMEHPEDPGSEAAYVVGIATTYGVPMVNLHLLTSTSTWEDAEAITTQALSEQSHSLLIVTDWYHSRRALCVINQQLAGTGIHVVYDLPPERDFRPDNWWRTSLGIRNVFSEVLKFGFYWLRYGLAPWRC